ncbi:MULTISPECIES: arginine/ornithine succinyltransferase subunit alpha [unclassified Hahella]|uniref:arginine/ornithine succinyltransferase subunit alpha n=1 Tax=unclassified Hahella TaxID=2624107 RepID=UPI001C1E9F83|nr:MULTISPECIES: arginine/ornithine succinyltransferase subunit alpha [unclassified Hahella]MBU6953496.1 arginine/ornithine succinyltransferase subunit alpha [Hahella sp. HN01]MDG9671712.1 arginine/ornithine succinyltransferase subunit alpha [Hahella sp. CR1]
MVIFRPSRFADLPGIEKLINESAAQVSTLPADRDKLGEKIDQSCRSFAGDESMAGKERYLFVLEDTESKEILGTSGIDACAGNGAPFYNYRLDELIHSSQQLGVFNKVPILYMTHELTGSPLLCSLTISPRYRKTEYFDLLSRSRFLFMGQHRERFQSRIIVEIQGKQGDSGDSPFWDSLGRHFFDMDFATADYYSGIKSKTFIAEMMPPHPIYVNLLTKDAQDAIAQPHSAARDNCQFLNREGFRMGRYIDIFDGGPTLEADLDNLTTVKSTKTKQVKLSDNQTGLQYLMCNTLFEDFRATLANVTDGMGDLLRLKRSTAEAILVSEGDNVQFAPL